MICDSSSVLSIDKKECLKSEKLQSFIDVNCKKNSMLSETKCSFCQAGYILQDNTCVKCLSDVSLEKGCFICDYRNDGVCLMCIEGYYMDKNGKCLLQDTTVDTSTDQQSSFHWVSQVQWLLLVFLC